MENLVIKEVLGILGVSGVFIIILYLLAVNLFRQEVLQKLSNKQIFTLIVGLVSLSIAIILITLFKGQWDEERNSREDCAIEMDILKSDFSKIAVAKEYDKNSLNLMLANLNENYEATILLKKRCNLSTQASIVIQSHLDSLLYIQSIINEILRQ